MEIDKSRIAKYISEFITATEQAKITWSMLNPTTHMFTKLTSAGPIKISIQRASTPRNEVVYVFTMFKMSGEPIIKFDSSDDKEIHSLLDKLYAVIGDANANVIYNIFDQILK